MNDFYVSSVEHSSTYDYIINKHYAHRLPSITYAFGLFKKTDNTAYMCGICTFGRPVSHILIKNSFRGGYTDRFYELNRLCVDDGLPKNTLSFFVSQCLKQLPKPMVIVSYADTSMDHHGYIYQSTNWIYTGLSVPFKDYMVKGMENMHGASVLDSVGRSDGKNGHLDKVKLLKEKYGEENVYMVERARKHRYFMFLGSKSEKRRMMQSLVYDVLPYPKGENKRYDASYKVTKQLTLL